ncbi:AN1-type zinc finger protein 1 [Kappamyces sp. JEL0680]|nr:AN1-type zinc finger protein 1 [Kappamyces sp. JEL0680]
MAALVAKPSPVVPLSLGPKKQKAKAPNPKLDLMKLKLNAKGNDNIAMAERVYLSVHYQGLAAVDALFYSISTVVGRLVDMLASRAAWVNENNLATKDSIRVALFHGITGIILPMESTLGDLIKGNVIYNGGSVILCRTNQDVIGL